MSLIKLNNSHMGGWGSFQKNTVQLLTLPSVNQLHTPAWVRSPSLYMSQRLGWLKAVSGQTCTSIFWLLVSTTARFVWCNPLLWSERPLVPLCSPSTCSGSSSEYISHTFWLFWSWFLYQSTWLMDRAEKGMNGTHYDEFAQWTLPQADASKPHHMCKRWILTLEAN